MTNLFRQAAELLKAKDNGAELSEEELQLIATAEIPFLTRLCPSLNKDMPVRECLDTLAKIVEEADQ